MRVSGGGVELIRSDRKRSLSLEVHGVLVPLPKPPPTDSLTLSAQLSTNPDLSCTGESDNWKMKAESWRGDKVGVVKARP